MLFASFGFLQGFIMQPWLASDSSSLASQMPELQVCATVSRSSSQDSCTYPQIIDNIYCTLTRAFQATNKLSTSQSCVQGRGNFLRNFFQREVLKVHLALVMPFIYFILLLCLFALLGIKPRVLHTLVKCSPKPHPAKRGSSSVCGGHHRASSQNSSFRFQRYIF